MKVKAGMDQFIDGLSSAGLGCYLQDHPELVKPLYVFSQTALTSG